MIAAVAMALIVLLIAMLSEDTMAHVFVHAPPGIALAAVLLGYTVPWYWFFVQFMQLSWWILFVIPIQRYIILTLYVKYYNSRYRHRSSIQGNLITLVIMETPSLVWFLIALRYATI
jgi:hypothetical protein